jgi:monooxygenase
MTTTTKGRARKRDQRAEYVDVLVVGAGISGIGTASRLKSRLPEKSFLILEARENIGGTWDLFRYPGLRADTDAQNFGFASKPWRGEKALADGSEILGYLQETVTEDDLAPHLRLGWKAVAAEWSSEQGLWTVQLSRSASGEASSIQCRWLFGATGYYDHEEGHRPHFEAEERFQGQIIHPQHWPDELDYTGKKVVVIGSGATAITLVPAMAQDAAHVTMLQRSPTYVISVPSRDVVTVALRKVLPERLSYAAIRRINRDRLAVIYAMSRRYPDLMRALVRWTNKRALPKGYPVDEHFRPHYNPWEERMCMAQDADFFKAVSDGSASVVTAEIARFTERGIALTNGEHLEADVVVTATGLRMMPLRAMALTVDGEAIEVADRVVYKSMMLSGVPNFAFAFGYTNAAWTLKVDLVAEHLCRLLAHLDDVGQEIATPVVNDPTLELSPMLDFHAGYVQRAMDTLPRRGSHGPWSMEQDYRTDRDRLLRSPLEDPALRLSTVVKNHLSMVS